MADPDQPLRWVGVGGRTAEFRPNSLTPAHAEDVLARELLEWMYVYDPDDRQVARFRGTADEVDLSDELKARVGAFGLYGESVIKDHRIVHNHPLTIGPGAIASFPPSPADLAMMVERDLHVLFVVSGDIQYVVRRPLSGWSFDETELKELLDDIDNVLDRIEGNADPTRPGEVERQQRRLEWLRDMRLVDYERRHRS